MGRQYSAPGVGIYQKIVNTKYYKGDINTSSIFLIPQMSLWANKCSPEMMDVMSMAIWYHGGEVCSDDKAMLKKVNDTLLAAKPEKYGLRQFS